ncbi:hypothetical protein EV176_001198 [Coemansia sp. RSA 451]|nr:hypothetical protein EV176_001198 [Coemansia sp. RSA 451]
MVSIDAEHTVTHVCCIGAGYVGGPTSAVMAHKCPNIQFTVVDTDAKRIHAWNSDRLPVYEPGLDSLVQMQRNRNLHFSTDIDEAICNAQIVMIAVNTPSMQGTHSKQGAQADLRQVEACARRVAQCARHNTIVVEKSTVPCGTGDIVARILREHARPHVEFSVLANPEFLSEGTAVRDLLHPDRVIIGGADADDRAQQALASVYAHWVPRDRIITMGRWSAELAKLASNAMLAQRVSSINSLSAVCEATGADVQQVARACGLDSRIGAEFLRASVGFGGSCFSKDVASLVWLSASLGLPDVAEYWDNVLKMNDSHMQRFTRRIVSAFDLGVRGIKIAVWGFAFKSGTGDARNTPAARICQMLLDQGAQLAIYDPMVPESQVREKLDAEKDGSYVVCADAVTAAVDAQAIVVLTPWPEFRSTNWHIVFDMMGRPARVFDGHNVLDRQMLEHIGFVVTTVGVRNGVV